MQPTLSQTSLTARDKKIISLFNQHHPATIEQINALGIKTEYVNKGCARQVYGMTNQLCVKVMYRRGEEYQSLTEIEVMSMFAGPILQELEPLRKHIPPLYYGNSETGVIVTRYYPSESQNGVNEESERRQVQNLLEKYLKIYDMHKGNFREDEYGNQIAVDLGWKSNY